MMKSDFFASNEDWHIDVQCRTLIGVMASLRLVSKASAAEIWLMSSVRLYNTMWKHKQDDTISTK